ncbi:MAG: PIG-L deacetylase family protein [Acidimicrobiia bacterium]|nr:MAG: PIG-L deacetylase family protein [Acidimicrobiia bacterium]
MVGLPAGNRVVVVAPHPDDETIMCGGTVAALVDRGVTVALVAVSDGEAGGDPRLSRATVASRRRDEQVHAAAVLGIRETIRLGLPDGLLRQHVSDLSAELARFLIEFGPGSILAPWWLDGHPDHEAVAEAIAMTVDDATEVWSGEVWGPLVPNRVVDVTNFMDKKLAAIDCYPTAAAAVDLAALAALSRYRSAFGLGGHGHAEAFIALTGDAHRAAVAGPQ